MWTYFILFIFPNNLNRYRTYQNFTIKKSLLGIEAHPVTLEDHEFKVNLGYTQQDLAPAPPQKKIINKPFS